MKFPFVLLLGALNVVNAYFLLGLGSLGQERADPIVNPGAPFSAHVHNIFGSSKFGPSVTSDILRQGKCTSSPIAEDNSNYWVASLYFKWKNGTYSNVNGGAVVYYLFPDPPNTGVVAFPDNFRMVSGTPSLRTYTNSSAQKAVTFLCLNFNGVSKRYNHLPSGVQCPSGTRAEINFPSCWNGKDLDSSDHKSHVDFLSEGPDKGSCLDPRFPVRIPRLFMEVYYDTGSWIAHYQEAMNPDQPFVLSMGDCTGYGHHGDFYNGWKEHVLQNAIDNCGCTIQGFGDPTCCGNKGVFTYRSQTPSCSLETVLSEQVLGNLPQLPGSNSDTGCTIPPRDGDILPSGNQPASQSAPMNSANVKPTSPVANPTIALPTSVMSPSTPGSSVILLANGTSSAISSPKATSQPSVTTTHVASAPPANNNPNNHTSSNFKTVASQSSVSSHVNSIPASPTTTKDSVSRSGQLVHTSLSSPAPAQSEGAAAVPSNNGQKCRTRSTNVARSLSEEAEPVAPVEPHSIRSPVKFGSHHARTSRMKNRRDIN